MKAAISLECRVGGTQIFGNSQPLCGYHKTMVDWLEIWADQHTDQICIAERKSGSGWRTLSHAQVLDGVALTAERLLER